MMTPPLSPDSSEVSQFTPGEDATVINMVSEPSSPATERGGIFWQRAAEENLDSEPYASSTGLTPPYVMESSKIAELFSF